MSEFLEFFKILGASLGILAFVWKIYDVLSSYLYIGIDVGEKSDNYQIIKTKVENRAMKTKEIDNAVLLVGPEDEDPRQTYNKLMGFERSDDQVKSTNAIAENKLEEQVEDNKGRIVMPLPFYYDENVQIGDEVVNYCVPIDTKNMQDGTPYSARFFIWAAGRYHRSTQVCFIK